MGRPKKKVMTSEPKERRKPGPKPKYFYGHSDGKSERIEPEEVEDPEEIGEPLFVDFDEAFDKWDGGVKQHAHLIFQSPRKDRAFAQKWKSLVGTIARRDNFKKAHLFQLEVLCDLFAEYDTLSRWVRKRGYTYTSLGRQGKQIKTYPEVAERNRVKDQIAKYMRMLGLASNKEIHDPKKAGGNEWI